MSSSLVLMRSLLFTGLLGLLPCAQAKTAWQHRNYTFAVPETPTTSLGSASFGSKSDALAALAAALGNSSSLVAYPGDVSYGSTIARVWTRQQQLWPDAIVYPETTEQVSIVMQFYAGQHAFWGDEGFAIMGGGHADFGGAQSHSVIIDLVNLGKTEFAVRANGTTSDPANWSVLKIGGGAEAGNVYSTLDGTGWAFLGPRAASIGVGGFLLGGGIAFQTNHYGVGADSIVGAEVVLVNGTVVYASPESDQYSDLFWALTGGGWLGFGVVTHFYVRAYPDPGNALVGTIVFGQDQAASVFARAADWWTNNNNPDAFPALVYYFKDPENPTAVVPIRERQYVFQLNALYFGGDVAQFNKTFGAFFDGATTITLQDYSLKTVDQYLLTNYPYGYNREFYGKSHTNSTQEFYQEVYVSYQKLIQGMLARGEDPGHTLWVDEYVLPAWGGFGPEWDSQTSWPHSTSAHITMTSGEWSNNTNTAFMHDQDESLMSYLRDFQNGYNTTSPAIYDYPNYIAPHSVTKEVWGDNFARLVAIKARYDPQCLFSRGRVPNTEACVAKGLANTY